MLTPALLGAVVLCAVPALGLSQPLTLTGYVIDGLTNRPLPGTKLHLYEWGYNDPVPGSHGPAAVPVTSDSEGYFAFTHLSRGQYTLQAELAHEVYRYGEFADPLYRNVIHDENVIHLEAESAGRSILFRIVPRARLEGFIRDEHAEKLEYVGVDLYSRGRRGGRIELMWAASAGLDPLGRYTFDDLWPGDYLVCAEAPTPSPGPFAPSGGSEVEYHPGQSRVYTETCYPDTKAPGSLFHLSSGERRSLDLTLRSAPSVTLTTTESVLIYRAHLPHPAPEMAFDAYPLGSDRWQIRNVPVGSYILYGPVDDGDRSEDNPGSIVRKPLTVESQPLTVELSPQKRGTIEFHVQPSDGRTAADGAAVSFLSYAEGLPLRIAGTAGRYIFDPGDYWLSIHPKPPFCAISQKLAGGMLQNGRITVTPGMSARLDVDIGTDCGAIDIHAISNGDPVPFASFLLLVNGTPLEPGNVVTGSMDARGRATIPQMTPGRYLLWAWVPRGDGFLGPDLSDAMAAALEVVVAAGQHASVSVDPIRSPGMSR